MSRDSLNSDESRATPRRRLQFSVRQVLLLTGAVAAGCWAFLSPGPTLAPQLNARAILFVSITWTAVLAIHVPRTYDWQRAFFVGATIDSLVGSIYAGSFNQPLAYYAVPIHRETILLLWLSIPIVGCICALVQLATRDKRR